MANRLIHKRRKCVKSPNIFRDKQEYSSLYTISSRSASSLHSSEMASQIGKQNNQSRVYKGQHQKGDAAAPTSAKSKPYGKYPKLPAEVSQELQQKVYSNCYKGYYNDRTQFIKHKFDNLTLENRQQCAKPYCPVYNVPPNKFPRQNHPANAQPAGPQQYVLNRLEESYWAKWKPNKCGDMDTWRNYLEEASYKRMQRCPPPSMMRECVPVLPPKTPPVKKTLKNKCCEEKRVKIIREPAEMRDSNSSEAVLSQQGKGKKSNCSCCSCEDESDTKSSRSVLLEAEESPVDTSQEEYENLYNEMYIEYEKDLMKRISEYEMQREAEEMREMEEHLAEQERRKQAELEAREAAEEIRARAEAEVRINELSKAEAEVLINELPRAEAEVLINELPRAEAENAEVLRESEEETEESRSNLPTDSENLELHQSEEQQPEIQELQQSEKQDLTREEKREVQQDDERKRQRETENRATSERTNQKKKAAEKELVGTSSNPNEYSEPEIAILKHTDSFIITSRRQKEERKEDRPRKSQPKFLKLTKTLFTASPPVKGHTYPLKPVLKKDKSPTQPLLGYNRPGSPVTPKMRTPARQFQPSYLLRR